MAGPTSKVTLKTIADEAGVTVPAVSRILNNKQGRFSEETRKKVAEIAERLKYRPNALIRGMQTGRSNMAGVMVPIGTMFMSRVVAGIHNVFLEQQTLMLLNWNARIAKPGDAEIERKIIHQLVDHRVDGVILRPSSEAFTQSYFEEIWERGLPLILVDREMSEFKTDFVGTDDIAGGRAAAEHLLELGHRDLLYIGSEKVSTARHREEGFRRVLSETGNARCRVHDYDAFGTNHQPLVDLLTAQDAPTGVFCFNDFAAQQVIDVAREAGLRVPEDLSVVGFGHQTEVTGKDFLTTFDQHPLRIGETAANLYLRRVNQEAGDRFAHELIKPDLLVNASSAPPRGTD